MLVSPATVSQGPGAYCGPHLAAASLPVCSSKELFGDSDDDEDMLLGLDAPCTPSPRVSLPSRAAPICSTDGLSDKSSGGITNSELSVI